VKHADREKIAAFLRRIASIIDENELNGPTSAEFVRGAAFWCEHDDMSKVTTDQMIAYVAKNMQN
jgi:hypothetical protein